MVMRYDSFKFLVMSFSLTNAPVTFRKLINDVLYKFLDEFVVRYLDYIVIYCESLEEHVRHLRLVFPKLREYVHCVKREKCDFRKIEIKLLGHIISHGSVRNDPRQVEAIESWSAPTIVEELRLFLGLVNYYRRFIGRYTSASSPLINLL